MTLPTLPPPPPPFANTHTQTQYRNRFRYRMCDAPAPKCGGLPCFGENNVTQVETRVVTLSPRNASWSAWTWAGPWSSWQSWPVAPNASVPALLEAEGACPLPGAEVQWRDQRRRCLQPNDTCTPMPCAGPPLTTAIRWRVQGNNSVAVNHTRLADEPACCNIGGNWTTTGAGEWSPWRYHGEQAQAPGPNCSLPYNVTQPRQRVRRVSRRCVSTVPGCGDAACGDGSTVVNETQVEDDYIPPRAGPGWSNWTTGQWSAWREQESSVCGQSTERRRTRTLWRTCLNTGCAPMCEGNSTVTDVQTEVRLGVGCQGHAAGASEVAGGKSGDISIQLICAPFFIFPPFPIGAQWHRVLRPGMQP